MMCSRSLVWMITSAGTTCEADWSPVGIYIGYYASQRQGDTIHSPQNCLPGAGWHPVETGVGNLQADGRTVTVNEFVIQKGLDRQVVFYWYQGRGRVVANEYANKAFLMLDAARLHRTNGGLVRLIAPIGLDGRGARTDRAVDLRCAAFSATGQVFAMRHLSKGFMRCGGRAAIGGRVLPVIRRSRRRGLSPAAMPISRSTRTTGLSSNISARCRPGRSGPRHITSWRRRTKPKGTA